MKIQKISKPYLVIHYDVADDAVRQKIRNYKNIVRMTQSVDLLGGSTDEAVAFWKFVAKETKNLWMKGDRIVIQFVSGDWSGLVWSNTFDKDKSSLNEDPDTQFIEYMFGELEKAAKG